MQILTLPSGPNEPFVRQRVTLTGREYFFIFKHARRYGHITFSLFTSEGLPVVLSGTLRTHQDLLRRCATTARPPGLLICSSTVGIIAPTLDDFAAGSVKLCYYEPEELPL